MLGEKSSLLPPDSSRDLRGAISALAKLRLMNLAEVNRTVAKAASLFNIEISYHVETAQLLDGRALLVRGRSTLKLNPFIIYLAEESMLEKVFLHEMLHFTRADAARVASTDLNQRNNADITADREINASLGLDAVILTVPPAHRPELDAELIRYYGKAIIHDQITDKYIMKTMNRPPNEDV